MTVAAATESGGAVRVPRQEATALCRFVPIRSCSKRVAEPRTLHDWSPVIRGQKMLYRSYAGLASSPNQVTPQGLAIVEGVQSHHLEVEGKRKALSGRIHADTLKPRNTVSDHDPALGCGLYSCRWRRSASSRCAMTSAGARPRTAPSRSTAIERTCSAWALESL